MKQQIILKEEMHQAIKEGVQEIAGLVKRTLGPGGLPILIERLGQALDGSLLPPMITKDGVTVANNCFAKDEVKNLVMQSIKAVCQKTNRRAGDGTSTAVVLGEALLNETFTALEKDLSLNPQLVKESLEIEINKIIDILDKSKIKIEDLEIVEQVANVSANGDDIISSAIKEAFEEVGAEGVITVDEGNSRETTIDIVKGFQVRRGSELKERFFNDQANSKFEAQDVRVVLYDGKLHNTGDIATVLRCAFKELQIETKGKAAALPPIIFVANEFSQDVLTFILMQKIEGQAQICAIRSPHASTVRTSMLEDLAILLGGTRLGSGTRNLSAITADDIGRVDRVVCDKYTTTFYDGWGEEESVLSRIDSLKIQRDGAESPHDAALISDRISSLNQAVAKIGIGGSTEMEIKEKYHRMEDALNAARAAVEDGVIPGGGTALLRIAADLALLKKPTIGQKILIEALQTPFSQILTNIGLKEEEQRNISKELLKTKNKVYNARTKVFEDAFEAGILDPVKVTKEALLNAFSIAGLLSTCGGGIVFKK